MNTTKQFWSLFKFQQSVNPFVIILPLIIAIPYVTTYFFDLGRTDYHPSLSLLLSSQNFYLVAILGVLWLAPEIVRRRNTTAPATVGTEFLLTRAVDRRIVARARIFAFYLIILIVPLAAFAYSLRQPSLTISEQDAAVTHKILTDLPGSQAAPRDAGQHSPQTITIPQGGTLLAGWRLWSMLLCALALQALVYLVLPWRYRWTAIWVLYGVIIVLPFLQLATQTRGAGQLNFGQSGFFTYAAHPVWSWLALLAVALLAQVWSERRFTTMEQV